MEWLFCSVWVPEMGIHLLEIMQAAVAVKGFVECALISPLFR